MVNKDFTLLNEIYNQRIYREDVGMGPENIGNAKPSPINTMKVKLPAPTCNKPGCDEDDELIVTNTDHEDHESNAYMVKQELFRIAKMAYMLHDIICDREELEPWFADKVSRAYEGLNSVFAYKDYEQFRDEVEQGMQVEEGTERDLFDSINRGGDSIINQIKRAVRMESKETIEKVLLECVKALEDKRK
jgi:hypothetical protein